MSEDNAPLTITLKAGPIIAANTIWPCDVNPRRGTAMAPSPRAAQGGPLVFVLLIAFYVWRMDKLDAEFGIDEYEEEVHHS